MKIRGKKEYEREIAKEKLAKDLKTAKQGLAKAKSVEASMAWVRLIEVIEAWKKQI